MIFTILTVLYPLLSRLWQNYRNNFGPEIEPYILYPPRDFFNRI